MMITNLISTLRGTNEQSISSINYIWNYFLQDQNIRWMLKDKQRHIQQAGNKIS
jgi:hypothetical protein